MELQQQQLQEIQGFNSPNITSGPVVIINERILFISSVYYNGLHSSANFYVGSGQPYENRILLKDELRSNNEFNNLATYNGENIYLKLPDSIKKFDYLGVWSDAETEGLGYVLFDNLQKEEISPADENYRKTADGRKILRVPRCCSSKRNNCTSNYEFQPNVTVHEHNTTHLNNETMNQSEYVLMPYNYFYPSNVNFFIAQPEDNFLLLENTSLFIVLGATYRILSHNEFCFLITKSGTELHISFEEGDDDSNKAAIVFQVLIIISTFCFALTSIFYWFVFKVKGVHKICFVCYASMMALTFLLMVINHFGGNIACSVIGSFFLFFINCSYGFLFSLCWDLQYIIKNHKENDSVDYKRLYFYIGGSLAYALIILLISLIPDGLPDVPKFFNSVKSGCQYQNTNEYKFFVPLLLVVIFSTASLIYCGILIKEKTRTPDYSWMKIVTNIKYMLLQSGLTLVLMAVFILWPIINFFNYYNAALDGLSYLQGLLIFCLYCLSHIVHNKIQTKKQIDLKRKKIEDAGNVPLNQMN